MEKINLSYVMRCGRVRPAENRIVVVNDLIKIFRGFEPAQVGQRCGIAGNPMPVPGVFATIGDAMHSIAALKARVMPALKVAADA